jgi:antitoxin PrlF
VITETLVVAAARNKAGNRRLSGDTRSFSGSIATTGNSRGLRREKAFFVAAPEFGTTGSAIRADVIGPGTVLIRIDTFPEEATEDPVIAAWLSFLDADMTAHPERLVSFQERELSALEALVTGVIVDDDETLPDDVTF